MRERFGRFLLHQLVGKGGMAEVYRASLAEADDSAPFYVALKRVKTDLRLDSRVVERFMTEADLGKLLNHENLLKVYQTGLVGQQPYMAMEYIYGPTLHTLSMELKRRHQKFPPELAIYCAMQVLRALDYVHAARSKNGTSLEIVHRDVTPSNIFISTSGEVKLGDLGVAHIALLDGTDTQEIAGKLAYMPPEMFNGAPPHTTDDVYAVGVILYELISGRAIPRPPDELLLSGKIRTKFPPLRKREPSVSKSLARAIDVAIRRNPRRRHQGAAEFYRALKVAMYESPPPASSGDLATFVSRLFDDGRYAPPSLRKLNQPFEVPPYQAPMDLTPTQRIQRIRRSQNYSTLFAWLAIFGGLLGMIFAVMPYFLREDVAPQVLAPVDIVPPPPLPVEGFNEDEAFKTPSEVEDDVTPYRRSVHAGTVALKRKKFIKALKHFRAAQKVKPGAAGAKLGEIEALMGIEDYTRAERRARQFLKKNPRSAAGHLARGDALWMLSKSKDAESEFRAAARLDPKGKVGLRAKNILRNLNP